MAWDAASLASKLDERSKGALVRGLAALAAEVDPAALVGGGDDLDVEEDEDGLTVVAGAAAGEEEP